jgi:hypothetical protein
MIKFFRHIRRSLIQENKMSKYFKYAFGEIILVVIGILIALQINNWNENRKKDQLKHEYIVSLKNDYTKDTIQINTKLRLNKQEQKYLATLKNRFADGSFKTLQDFKNLYNRPRGIMRFTNTYNTNSFNLLISSGNIDLLDKELREEIMELNRLQNFVSVVTIHNRDYFFKIVENLDIKYPSTANPFNTKTTNDLLWKGVNVDALPRDLTTYLGQFDYTINRYVQLTESVILQTEKVLHLLHQEYD